MEIEKLYSIFLSCGSKVTTDSRKISGGELFYALKGENFDGNLYALQALEKGAAYAVVDAASEVALHSGDDRRIIPVPDTLHSLWALARRHRDSFHIPVLGLTGTNGKTTTKELVNAVLSTKFRTHATSGNLNNNIGVPLTVLSMPRDTEIAIIEMGASHPGDIRELVAIAAPDYGLITNVGTAHLLGFGSFEGVKATKGELYDFIAESGSGTIFLNSGNPYLVEMSSSRGFDAAPEGFTAASSAAMKGRRLAVKYGLESSGAEVLRSDAEHPFLSLRLHDGAELHSKLVGSYNADNVLAALKVGEFFGVEQSAAVAAIEAYSPSNNRSQMQRTERNVLIVDAYNANPSSMKAALDNFAGFDAAKKIVLLGNMLELGDVSVSEHRKVLEAVSSYGFHACYVGDEFRKAGASPCFDSSEALADYISAHVAEFSEAAILVKGSRGTKMERVIPVL